VPSFSSSNFSAVIELTAHHVYVAGAVSVDGVYIAYVPAAAAALQQQERSARGSLVSLGRCIGDLSLADHCDERKDDCFCVHERDDVSWLILIPVCALLISVPIQCWCVRRWRRRVLREEALESKYSFSAGSMGGGRPRLSPLELDSWAEEPHGINCPSTVDREMPRRLLDVLAHPDSREAFRAFLQEKSAAEYLLFFESIQVFEDSNDRQWRQAEANKIIHRFVKNDAPYRINLQHATQQRLMEASSFPKNLFDAAKMEVYNLMQLQFLDAFLQTARALSPRGRPVQWTSFRHQGSGDDGGKHVMLV
jgi:hypothetical protein